MVELDSIWTKRFIIANEIIWQYFVIVVFLLWTGAAGTNTELIVVYTAGVALILNYYMKSDAERHQLE